MTNEIERARVRGFVAVLLTYPATRPAKVIKIAVRAFAAANSINFEEASEVANSLIRESDALACGIAQPWAD